MLRRVIYIGFVIIVLAVAINDVTKYLKAQRILNDTAYDLVTYAADQMNRPRDDVAAELAGMGTQRQVRVTMYGQNAKGVQLWTEKNVAGTVFLAPVYNMILGEPFAEAWTNPLVIKDYRVAGPH